MVNDDDLLDSGAAPVRQQGSALRSADHPGHEVMEGSGEFEGYLVSVNPTFQDVLGWSADELTSVPFWELLHHDDQHPAVELVQRSLLSGPGRLTDVRARMLCRDGSYRWTRWNADADQKTQRWCARGVDISGLVAVEDGKRVRVGAWDWHVPTNTLTGSDGLFEVYGVPVRSGQNMELALARIHPEDRGRVTRLVRRFLESAVMEYATDGVAEPLVVDHRILHPQDGVRWVHSVGRVTFGDDGRPERIRGLVRDVTDIPMNRIVG
ncbi:MAG: hypothetical protein QOG20_4657 [Pseudonocardiales bacterium]|nr:hypothetical protein [Pseudonocardiales bacterium]